MIRMLIVGQIVSLYLQTLSQVACQSAGVLKAHYYLVKMNFQIHNPDHHHESLEEIGFHKEEHLDRTTHQLLSTPVQHHHPSVLNDISPLRGSFFFTPNSPKHFRFDLQNNPDDSNAITHKKGFQPPASVPSISRKINLALQEENSEMMANCQQLPCSEFRSNKRNPPNRSTKNAKGLRNLSESVYRIVSELTVTRYKEVADRLLAQIGKESQQDPQSSKEQHNIKRRVYDALNVLIAAGILRKEGKQVACNEPYSFKKAAKSIKNTRQHIEKQQMQLQLLKKAEALRDKEQKIRKLQEKRKLIEYIIKRNKGEVAIEDKILRFPLIGSIISKQILEIYREDQSHLSCRIPQRLFLYGDVDMLLKINKDSMETDKLLENICSEVKKEQDSS